MISLVYQLIDSTSSVQSKCSCLIKSRFAKKYIELPTKKDLTTHYGIIPKFNALPKDHKSNLSVRPYIKLTSQTTFHNYYQHFK